MSILVSAKIQIRNRNFRYYMNSYQQVIDPGFRSPTVYDQKYVDFVDNVLKEVADDFEREKQFSDQNLLKLHKLFDGVFERALDLYEQQRVTQISTSNAIITEPCKSANEASWLLQVRGHSGALYTLFPEINYCTCAAFRHQVLTDRSAFTCKHVLAAWLASVDNEKLLHQQLIQKQFDNLLLYQTTSTCLGSENGLKITIEHDKCLQASVYFPSTVFDEFKLKEDGTGYPLSIIIEEDGIITDCSLKTLEVEELLDFHIETEDIVNKVVLQTELLAAVTMAELDPTCRIVELRFSPEKPFFRIGLAGMGSICHIDLPHDNDLINTFQCTKTVTSLFMLGHFKPAINALSCASKVSLRTNNSGLLCFQYMVKTEDGNTCYMEFYISSIKDWDSEY
ncbi:cell cycle checkpoint protein RAD1 [Mycetomoellerius zeteki]|uniref:cell cycle checkpoint protein RAD1 n=1 Tax=Mycetomoellerius zeteki TaxID=64791 RepID=UPI00084EBB54|nr:PREDICTED: cell cycle checkpoint protein RAD1-like [Trachymyrmex zeteki]